MFVTHEGRAIPLDYEADMARFAAEQAARPVSGEIVFTGSSTIVCWTTLVQDMAPLPVRNRAFGGSDTAQVWWYANRAVLPSRPRLVVVYSGDNDMPQVDVTVDNYLKYMRLFVGRVHEVLPRTHLVLVSNKPSISRWALWPKYQEANQALQEYCAADSLLTYADLTGTLLDDAGQVRPDCYGEDGLHFLPFVYQSWTAALKPLVSELWASLAR